MQTLWYRSRDEAWLRLTRFFGTLLLINFAIGVATGLVQEFEFGMNWSEYSKFVGNVFGAPLAIEGLAAFMLGMGRPSGARRTLRASVIPDRSLSTVLTEASGI